MTSSSNRYKMNIRTKELAIDVLTKTYQIVFATLVVGPFVTEKFSLEKIIIGSISCLICIFISAIFSFSIKKEM